MSRLVSFALGALALALGTRAALHHAWLCDDAFISFRYADHLARGLGLVYNAGERVEGYTNFLWTVGLALGIRLGVAPERWAIGWGVTFHVATLAILFADRAWPDRADAPKGRRVVPAAFVPLACALVAVHPDAQRYATGGLETSMFGFLVTAGALFALRRAWGLRALVCAGIAFGFASLTRPDGLLFVPLVASWVAARRPGRVQALMAFLLPVLALWGPVTIVKAAYYGDWLPNTFWAKSAGVAWWSQGWTYASLYFRRYAVLAIALPVALAAWAAAACARRSGAADDALFALGLSLAYTLYVMRVGGDFMFARLLVPVAPLMAIALARGLDVLLERRAAAAWVTGALAVAALAISPAPIPPGEIVSGIADEPTIYTRDVISRARREGETLRRYFDGQPVTIAIVGSQAALAWYANPATVIEAGAGLTDRTIARQPLAERGRVGHEKQASVAYLLARRADFTLHHVGSSTLGLDAVLPRTVIHFDTIPGRIVHWNPTLLATMKARGARFFDLPGSLDLYCSALDQLTDEQARRAYAQMRAFYFAFVPDSVHEHAFLERLANAKPEGGTTP